MALGEVVRRWRAELGWKQEELARRSGGLLAQGNISGIERGLYPNATLSTLQGLATAFGVSLDALVAAAAGPPDQIPSIVEALPPDLAGLPGWARDFHRWGSRLSPAQRASIIALARSLAEESPPDAEVESHAEP